MTKCDCCGQEVEHLYRVQVRDVDVTNKLACEVDGMLPTRIAWLCGKCEVVLRVMASVGMFTVSHVQASVNDCSLEMWE